MTITADRRADTVVLALYGELDMTTVPSLEAQLELARSGAAKLVVVDLSGLRYLDASGLRALLRAHDDARQAGQQLELAQLLTLSPRRRRARRWQLPQWHARSGVAVPARAGG